MTLPEAAKALGVKPTTLRHQIKNRRLRAYRMGRSWFVTAEEVARYRVEVQGKNEEPIE